MSNMKCPFCNGELVGTIGHPICRNQNCVMCDDPMPQDLLEELIRTRKALYLAFEMLKDIKNDPDTNDELTQEIADRLDEITASEKSELENLEMLVNNVFK